MKETLLWDYLPPSAPRVQAELLPERRPRIIKLVRYLSLFHSAWVTIPAEVLIRTVSPRLQKLGD